MESFKVARRVAISALRSTRAIETYGWTRVCMTASF